MGPVLPGLGRRQPVFLSHLNFDNYTLGTHTLKELNPYSFLRVFKLICRGPQAPRKSCAQFPRARISSPTSLHTLSILHRGTFSLGSEGWEHGGTEKASARIICTPSKPQLPQPFQGSSPPRAFISIKLAGPARHRGP